jgi:hypothetical protein
MGDDTIEELFVLVTDIGRANVKVAIAPNDPRVVDLRNDTGKEWVSSLYKEITKFFGRYTNDV